MAEGNESRASSRRTTPRTGLESTRTTRATRSQSRDISDSEGGKNDTVRRGQQQGPTGAVQSGDGKMLPKARKGRPLKQARALQDLPTVTEDPSVVYPNVQAEGVDEDVEVDDHLHEQAVHDTKSPGGISAFSGTTARTSRSAQELAELVSDDLLDALPDLYDASSKLLRFIVASNATNTVRSQMQNKKSREYKKLLRLSGAFQVQREVYGGAVFINLSSALGTLLQIKNVSNIPASRWRPDPLFQSANLATLAANALILPRHSDNEHFLEELEQNFPKQFVADFVDVPDPTVGRSGLLQETLRFAIEIRTQYAIMQLARYVDQPNYDSDIVLDQVFYEDSKTPRGWDLGGLRSEHLTAHNEDAIIQRLQEIRQIIDSTSLSLESSEIQPTAIQCVRARFTWSDLVDHALLWTSLRDSEIQHQLAIVDGAEGIAQHLEVEIRERKQAKSSLGNEGIDDEGPQLVLQYEQPSEVSHDISEQTENLRGMTTRANKFNLAQFSANSPRARAAAAYMKQREAGRSTAKTKEQVNVQLHKQDASRAQVSSTAGPFTQALTPQRNASDTKVPSSAPAKITNIEPRQHQVANLQGQDMEDDDEDDAYQTQELNPHVVGEATLARRDRREAESNKENQLQVPESQLRSDKKRHITDRQPNAQRVQFDSLDTGSRQSQIEDVSEDEGFRAQPHQSSNRSVLGPLEELQSSGSVSIEGRSTKRVRLQRGFPRDVVEAGEGGRPSQERVPRPSQIGTYNQANLSAKERKAMVPKKPQSRKAWSDEETGQLIDLICEFGTSWTLLKDEDVKKGHILVQRDQGSLKDKARNMKLDYLKAGRILPVNFEYIVLSNPQIQRLRDVNVEYDPDTGRRKDDLFEDSDAT